ncbi:hypothetical protein [Stenotrophomonas sp. NPDC077659]|uniref:hypothetical protein n=1 Tax=Stenotrophomonas sp. NPDC077659 TaxID=3390694 RepID=UPI003CFD10A2
MKVRKEVLAFSALSFALCLVGCGYEERGYESLSHVSREGDLSVASALSIPGDAAFLRFRSDVESGLYFTSYETHDSAAYIQEHGMLVAVAPQDKVIRDSIGFNVNLPGRARFYYTCSSSLRYRNNPHSGYDEIILMGVADDRVYQWNRRHDERLGSVLCNGHR